MKCTHFALLFALTCGLVGCGSASHGPAVRVVSTTTDNRLTLAGGEQVTQETVHLSRLRDAAGREWTETTVLASEQVPLAQIEADLFEAAQHKLTSASTAGDR